VLNWGSRSATTKKEDRDAFLARTQAQRQARQQTKHVDVSAVRIQSVYRRHIALKMARDNVRAKFDEHLDTRKDLGWASISSLLRQLTFICSGVACKSLSCDDVNRLGATFAALQRSVEFESGQSGCVFDGIVENLTVFVLQLQRICALAVQFLDSSRYGRNLR
jgi:hypothetical protein